MSKAVGAVVLLFLGAAADDFLPYPKSMGTNEGPLYLVSTESLGAPDVVSLYSLSGVLARASAQLFVVASEDDSFWLDEIVKASNISTDSRFYNDFHGALRAFAVQLDGYIFYSAAAETNAAITLASGAAGSVIVSASPETCFFLERLGVPRAGDATGLSSRAAFELAAAGGLLSRRVAVFAPDDGSKPGTVDYALFGRAAVVEFTGPAAATRSYDDDGVGETAWATVLASMDLTALNAGMGWLSGGDEFGYMRLTRMRALLLEASPFHPK